PCQGPEDLDYSGHEIEAESEQTTVAPFVAQPSGNAFGNQGDQSEHDDRRQAGENGTGCGAEFTRAFAFREVGVNQRRGDAFQETVGQPPDAENAGDGKDAVAAHT